MTRLIGIVLALGLQIGMPGLILAQTPQATRVGSDGAPNGALALDAHVKGKARTFQAANDDASSLIDLGTRSTWNAYGLCLEGPLKGTQLKQVILVPQFWFAWSQFHQGTRVFAARALKEKP